MKYINSISIFFVIAVYILAGNIPYNYAQTAQKYYEQGLELKAQYRFDDALKAFKNAIRKNREFAEAYYETAVLYQSKKTTASLVQAEEAILSAKKYGSNDVKYLSVLAYIYEDREMFFSAKLTWDRVLKLDPDNTAAHEGETRHIPATRQNKIEEITQFPVDVLCYSGENGKTLVKFYYGVPLAMVSWVYDTTEFRSVVQHTIHISDMKRKTVADFKEYKQLTLPHKEKYRTSSNDQYLLSRKFELEPGMYSVEVKLYNPHIGKNIRMSDYLLVEKLSQDSLHISDFLIAYSIKTDDTNKQLMKNNLEKLQLYHHPAHMYIMNRPIYVYFEIYGFFAGNEFGQNRYKLEYAIDPLKKERVSFPKLNKFFNNTEWEETKNEELWISSECSSMGRSDYQFIRIDHYLNEQGKYLFTVRVTDEVSGMSVEKSTPIWIFSK